MEPITINVQLTVEKVDQNLIAHLVFKNETSEKFLLDKYTICLDGKFRKSVFEITDAKGKKVSYFGIMVKRVVSEDDFIQLEPGQSIKVSVKLNDAYRLEPGKKYSIKYFAYNPGLSENSPFIEMISNPISIHYK
jgi:hypothetical protein